MLNVKLVYDYLIVDELEDPELQYYMRLAIPVVLDETQAEIKRLLEHPELFPDGAHQWFPQVMKLELSKVLDHVALLYDVDEKENTAYQERLKRYRKQILPSYDDARTTWQQFLHNHAPGSGIPKDQMHPQGCTQMFTAACLLMAANRRDEHQGFAHSFEEVRSAPPNSFTDSLVIMPS